jgi:hypothetical protein
MDEAEFMADFQAQWRPETLMKRAGERLLTREDVVERRLTMIPFSLDS